MMGEMFDSQKKHRHSIRLKGYDYSQAGAYFVTICAWQRECLFGDAVAGEMRLSAAGKIVQWEWRHLGEGFANVQLGAFVVMPNHVHGIIFIHGAERATRTGQNEFMEEECQLPDDTGIEIVGSPVHIDGANVGATHPSLVERISAGPRVVNLAFSGTDGSPRRGPADGPDMEIPPASPRRGPADTQDMDNFPASPWRGPANAPDMDNSPASPRRGPADGPDMEIPPASPRRGSTDAIDMEFPAGDVESDAAERATRHEQNLPIYDDHPLPDKAIEDIVGSPLRGPGGPPPQSLGAIIGQWKSRVTKRAWKLPGMQGVPIWQRSYYEHIIRDEGDLRRIEEYIQNNPQRWAQDQLHPQASPNQFNQDR